MFVIQLSHKATFSLQ